MIFINNLAEQNKDKARHSNEKTKQQKIKAEFNRLKKVYKNLDTNKLIVVQSLIKNAAWMAVTLQELQEDIDKNGYVSEYQNGQHQKGEKQSESVKTHIAMTKNHSSIMKILAELAPPAPRQQSKLDKLREE